MNRHSGLIIVLGFVVVLGSLVVRQSIGQIDSQPTVQRWEYKVVNLDEIEMNAKDGQEIKDAIETQFNALGEKGRSLAKLDRAIAVFKKSSK